jgi:thioredoxin 1
MSVLHLDKNNFGEAILSEKPILIDFYADWCGPCRMLGPIIEDIAAEREDLSVAKINVDAEPELAAHFGVVSIPTLVLLQDGKEVRRASGSRPKAGVLKLIDG